jgi:hypothetical protein
MNPCFPKQQEKREFWSGFKRDTGVLGKRSGEKELFPA